MVRYKWRIAKWKSAAGVSLKNVIRIMLNISVTLVIFFVVYVMYDACVVNSSSILGDEIMELAPQDDSFVFNEWTIINPDIVAWLKIDGTNINYPVLQAENNDYYLVRNYRREFATAGSVFLDYRDDIRSDNFLVIYGHRMSMGVMFSDVTKYVNYDYFISHKVGMIYTERGSSFLKVIGFAKIKNNARNIYVSHGDADAAVEYLRENAIFWDEDVEIGDLNDAHFVMLSTCDADDKSLRDVLLLFEYEQKTSINGIIR